MQVKNTWKISRQCVLVLLWILSSTVDPRYATSLTLCRQNETIVQLVNNGYENVGVWISNNVPEDFDLIPKLEELISKISAALFEVTKKRAYIRNVQILIPHSWQLPKDFQRHVLHHSEKLERKSQSQIWIKNSSPRKGSIAGPWQLGNTEADVVQPYVIKATPCGFPGSYIRMSPEFIRFGNESAVVHKIGPPEKILVREWAKLRWGVYDEVAKATATSDYYLRSDLTVQPIVCSSSIPGENINERTLQADCDVEASLYEKTCHFEAAKVSNTEVYASLMYRADLPYVNKFCDDTDDSVTGEEHDGEAPTVHNLHCGGRSVWRIMREHPDFTDWNNPPSFQSTPPSTNFTLVQQENERIVLVLDVSSSMKIERRVNLMRQAVSHFIDTLPENTFVGIVCFAWRAFIKANLTQVRNQDIRNDLKKRVIDPIFQGTSVGSGILKAIEVLKFSGPSYLPRKGGRILVLTDGIEHNRPKINETIADVKASGVTISTIAFGSSVAPNLESLATASGGHTHFASSGEFGIDTELQDAFSSHHEHSEGGAIQVLSDAVGLAKNSTLITTFIIDETLGKDTRVTVFYNNTKPPLITLRSPLGRSSRLRRPQNNIAFHHERAFKTIYIKILDEAESGIWSLTLRNQKENESMLIRVSVVSYQKGDDPLIITPSLLCRSIDFTGSETVTLYAELSKGELAVLSALVYTEITRPLTSSGMVDVKKIYLRDDGLDPDVTSNDGVYSAYFTSFTRAGRYNVKVFASDNNGQAEVDSNYILGIGNFKSHSIKFDTRYLFQKKGKRDALHGIRDSLSIVPLSSFQRVSSAAGAFNVRMFAAEDSCTGGYVHFQDSCYKVVSILHSSNAAKFACEKDGGKLILVDSRQELAWILSLFNSNDEDHVSQAWIGGVDNKFPASDELQIENILHRSKRTVEDFDLQEIITSIKDGSYDEEFLSTFDPDLSSMSTPEMERFLSAVGLESKADLFDLIRVIKENKNSTRPRIQEHFFRFGSGDFQLQADYVAQSGLFEQTSREVGTNVVGNYTSHGFNNVAAESAPSPHVKRNIMHLTDSFTCSWIENNTIFKSKRDDCNILRKVICEKPMKDRYPPSRIMDLKARYHAGSKTLNLTWSAPGDDFNVGKATRYEIRTLRTRRALKVLTTNFERGERLTLNKFEDSDKVPKWAGDPETVVVNMTENTGEFEVNVAALSFASVVRSLFQFRENLNLTEIEDRLTLFNYTEKPKQTLNAAVHEMFEKGRHGAPKVLLAIIEDEVKTLSHVTTDSVNITKIIVSTSKYVDRAAVWNVASSPACKNSFFVERSESLIMLRRKIANQLCHARTAEFQAVAVKAFDEAGQSRASSNVFPFRIPNSPKPSQCKEIPTPGLVVAGNPATTTIVLSVGVPVSAILAVVGSVMLLGQLKKYQTKRKKQRKQEEEKKIQEAIEARKKRRSVKSPTSDDIMENGNKNNCNNSIKQQNRLFAKHRKSRIGDLPWPV